MGEITHETPEFRHDYRTASKRDQDKIEAFIRKFTENERRAGMDLKPPKRAADPHVRTARVDSGLRAVLAEVGPRQFTLLRVMEHDAAYRWAERVRIDVSSFNGLPRLVVLDVADEVPLEAQHSTTSDRFEHRTAEDFDTVGVSPAVMTALRHLPSAEAVTALADDLGQSDALLGVAILGLLDRDRSVEEIFDELVTLEGRGELPERSNGVWNGLEREAEERPSFDTEDVAAALGRPGAQERFRVVEDSEELVAALQGDFSDWQIFLHPLQHQAAYSEYSGPARVSGGAGTGKTVVLLHRVKALLERAREDEPRILLTTYTAHLKQDLSTLLKQLVGKERATLVDIETVDGLARRLHREMSGDRVHDIGREEELRLWDEIAADMTPDRSPAFLRNEYRHVLLARSVRTLDQYLTVSRAGRGVRLPAEQRRALWPAFERFDVMTRTSGRMTSTQLTETVAALVEQLPAELYEHVLVDEAQDLHACQWRLLRSLTAAGSNDLFIAGDALQRIYGDTVSLRSVGIDTRGRSVRLRRNYRTTHEIIGWALGIVGDDTFVDLDELGTDLSGYHSVRYGPRPHFASFASPIEEADGVARQVRQWLKSGYALDNIAVVARTKDQLVPYVAALQNAGVSVAQLGKAGRVAHSVNAATMHRVKGLEYRCVAVVGLSAGSVPPLGAVCLSEDDHSQHLTDLQTERSLVYVAATRARDEVSISWHCPASPLFAEALPSPELLEAA